MCNESYMGVNHGHTYALEPFVIVFILSHMERKWTLDNGPLTKSEGETSSYAVMIGEGPHVQ